MDDVVDGISVDAGDDDIVRLRVTVPEAEPAGDDVDVLAVEREGVTG